MIGRRQKCEAVCKGRSVFLPTAACALWIMCGAAIAAVVTVPKGLPPASVKEASESARKTARAYVEGVKNRTLPAVARTSYTSAPFPYYPKGLGAFDPDKVKLTSSVTYGVDAIEESYGYEFKGVVKTLEFPGGRFPHVALIHVSCEHVRRATDKKSGSFPIKAKDHGRWLSDVELSAWQLHVDKTGKALPNIWGTPSSMPIESAELINLPRPDKPSTLHLKSDKTPKVVKDWAAKQLADLKILKPESKTQNCLGMIFYSLDQKRWVGLDGFYKLGGKFPNNNEEQFYVTKFGVEALALGEKWVKHSRFWQDN